MTNSVSRALSRHAVAISGTLVALAAPLVTFAAISDLDDVGSFVINFINNVLVPVLFAVAFIVFLCGAFQAFILGASDGSAKEKGKNLMLWGLIGFFVMISIWGLVNILVGTITFGNPNAPTPPKGGFNVTPP